MTVGVAATVGAFPTMGSYGVDWKRSSESAAFAPRRARLFLGKSAVAGAGRDDEQVASSRRPFRLLRCLGELRIGVPPRGEKGLYCFAALQSTQLTHAAETGCPAIQVEMIMDHAKSRDPCDPFPALSEDRFQVWLEKA